MEISLGGSEGEEDEVGGFDGGGRDLGYDPLKSSVNQAIRSLEGSGHRFRQSSELIQATTTIRSFGRDGRPRQRGDGVPSLWARRVDPGSGGCNHVE